LQNVRSQSEHHSILPLEQSLQSTREQPACEQYSLGEQVKQKACVHSEQMRVIGSALPASLSKLT
jgi:hypothetical protein